MAFLIGVRDARQAGEQTIIWETTEVHNYDDAPRDSVYVLGWAGFLGRIARPHSVAPHARAVVSAQLE
jgi:hypothetical protein